ncbi:hypothetical protein K435DRAFT_669316 [Dendrothele bispora CBS 962.96]|uniref:RING-type domain-containing protein n=1 Tax=Dendrothele bispora (strain CBS 962.96) TaxID=1314807 RepID=A0A4S8LWC0_DENBC|nr:hypothetical protein K435DRAFT_669316 [Dendrothele bispora CBS 962.96]
MLCLASESACDICLDAFDNKHKVPCVLDCGHVFCQSCIPRVDPPVCPVCREEFDPQHFIKMYGINIPTTTGPLYSEASHIRKAIEDVINLGTTETEVPGLIAECKAFARLREQEFDDLRNTCRLLVHLCNVQTRLNQHERLVKSLQEERVNFQASENDLRRKLNETQSSMIDLLK